MAAPPVNQVEQRAYTGARLQAADFGGGRDIAQGAQNLAHGLEDTSNALDKIGEMYDTAAVKTADAQDLQQIMQIRAKAMSSEGFDSQTAIGDARDQISEIRKNRLASLHNSRQRQMYADVFDQRNLQIEEGFANHSITEIQKANQQAALSRADSYSDMAVDTYGTDAFDTNLATALNETATVNAGQAPEVIQRQQAKVRSGVYSRAIAGMLANPDHVQEAQIALDKHAADLLPDDELKLRKEINPILEEDQTETDAGWAFSGSDAPSGPDAPSGSASSDPLAPTPDAPATQAAPTSKAPIISPTDPLRGKGRISNTAAQHRARGSGNAVDIAAPAGTPIYAPMSGKVIKNWWSKEGGWSVLVQHPNGYVTGYAHMRTQSPMREGATIEPNIPIGSVGMTGEKATGPHVHYTVRQSSGGPKVDPDAVDWGGTVKPDSVNWKETGIVKYTAEKNTLGTAMDRLYERAQKENWSPHRYDNAVARARQIAGVQDQLYNDNQQQIYDNALKSVVELGDNLTSRAQVPGFSDLDPTRQLAIDNIIKGNKTARTGEGGPGSSAYFDLYGMAMDPTRRGEFLKVDLLKVPGISNGERKQLFATQWGLRNDQDGKLQGQLDEASGAANRYLPATGANGFTPQTRQKFMDRYMQTVTARQNDLKRPLTDREKDDVARALVVPVVRYNDKGVIDKNGMMFQGMGQSGEKLQVNLDKVFDTIPPETRNNIIIQLQQAGKPHTKYDVANVYLQMAR